MAASTWKCQHVSKGVKCGHDNPRRKAICEICQVGRRPARKPPAHRHVMDVFPYEAWVAMFGEQCGICGKPPKPGKKLHRDHDHRVQPGDPTQGMRGLLCYQCNLQLHFSITLEWATKMLAYLQRHHGVSTR